MNAEEIAEFITEALNEHIFVEGDRVGARQVGETVIVDHEDIDRVGYRGSTYLVRIEPLR